MNRSTTMNCPVDLRTLALVLLISAGAVTGCASGGSNADGARIPAPDDTGIYAHRDGELMRLDGDPEWERETWEERANLASGTTFVVRDAALAESSEGTTRTVGLRRVAWVRSRVSNTGEVMPVTGSRWQVVDMPALAVSVDTVRRAQDQPKLVQLRPLEPLEPGLYSIYLDTAQGTRNARFGVRWPELDKQSYASGVCVDQHPESYHPCGDQTAVGAGEPLRIHLVEPEMRSATGSRTMIVTGVILNQSKEVQEVPPLTAELVNADQQVLASWRFEAASRRLEPGQSTSFRSSVDAARPDIHSVHVDFVTAQTNN